MPGFSSTPFFLERIKQRTLHFSYDDIVKLAQNLGSDATFVLLFYPSETKLYPVKLGGSIKNHLPEPNNIKLKHLHRLIWGAFYDVIVKSNWVALQHLLVTDGYEHLKGTYSEMCFPSSIRWNTGLCNEILRVLEAKSHPVFCVDKECFAVVFGLSFKGIIHRKGDFMTIQAIIKRNGQEIEELVEESKKLAKIAAVEIFAHIGLFTNRQLDVMEFLVRGKREGVKDGDLNKYVSSKIMSRKGKPLAEGTVQKLRSQISGRIEGIFNLTAIEMAMKMAGMGCF